jgi:hypothetical protein
LRHSDEIQRTHFPAIMELRTYTSVDALSAFYDKGCQSHQIGGDVADVYRAVIPVPSIRVNRNYSIFPGHIFLTETQQVSDLKPDFLFCPFLSR